MMSAGDFGQELLRAARCTDLSRCVVIDLRGVDFMDSLGLQARYWGCGGAQHALFACEEPERGALLRPPGTVHALLLIGPLAVLRREAGQPWTLWIGDDSDDDRSREPPRAWRGPVLGERRWSPSRIPDAPARFTVVSVLFILALIGSFGRLFVAPSMHTWDGRRRRSLRGRPCAPIGHSHPSDRAALGVAGGR